MASSSHRVDDDEQRLVSASLPAGHVSRSEDGGVP